MILHSSEALLMIKVADFIKRNAPFQIFRVTEEAVYCSIVYNSKNLKTMEMPIISITTGHILIEPIQGITVYSLVEIK